MTVKARYLPRMSAKPIESNVPIPSAGHARRRYPWEDLGLGDSVAYPHSNYWRVTQAAHRYRASRPGWNYIVRTVVEDGIKYIRVWRIA